MVDGKIRLDKSFPLTILAMVIVFAAVLFFANSVSYNLEQLLHFGHYFEMIAIGIMLVVIFIPNLMRMWYFTIVKTKTKVPFKYYVTALEELFVNMFTQKRSKDCDEKNNLRWLEHMILVLSYLSLLFTTVFLNWFVTDNLFVIIVGYIVSFLIFVVTIHFVSDRVKKNKSLNKFSQPSDWFFVIWLLLMGITAFLVRLFIDMNILETNKWMYLIHLTILAQWALIIVPFGKWTHFLYRSFGIYFAKMRLKKAGG